MNQEFYEELADFDDDIEMDMDSDFDEEDDLRDVDIDEMLEALMDDDEGSEEDLAERRRRRKFRSRRRSRRPKRVRTASGSSAYRASTSKKYVTQPQLKNALGRVAKDVRRNALGVKTVNKKLGNIDAQVDGVISVNRVQNTKINKLRQQMKLDGALEFAESITANDNGSLELNLLPMLKGAVKSGMLGGSKGALSNPAVVGGLGFLLSNPQILSGILGAKS